MFAFKRFAVKDDRCAMKVGVDSVLFGSWMDVNGARRLLDAGCGSGLLALMAAQRLSEAGASGFYIDAIDIESGAVADSADNFVASPWVAHLSARQVSLQDFADEADPASYDLIFCNPPYYDDSPTSGSVSRDTARSTDTLSRRDLLFAASKLLTDRGRLSLILPFDQGKKMILEATLFGWFMTRQCFIKTKSTNLPKRLMLEFSPSPGTRMETETLVLGNERYRELTSGFYL
ncbi:MAG: methyltransferase [Bacteroidales bacterium]|nr:methyltransferase [Bacteroidales bacterium]